MSVGWPNVCTLGGITLDVSDGSSLRAVTGMPGWDDAPAARTSLQPRMQQDGAWDAAGFSDARVITISGFMREASSAAARTVLRQLAALPPQSIQEFVVVNAAIGALSVLTRVTVGVKPVWYGDCDFDYSITITAPDPLKYGARSFATTGLSSDTPGAGLLYPLAYPIDYGIPPGVTPGAVRVANAGTTQYWPTLRIDGAATNPVATMVETGAWVRYGAVLTSGQWLDIDLANRRVLLQGQVSVRHNVTFGGDWLSVQPGGGSITWTADVADSAAQLSVWGREGAWS